IGRDVVAVEDSAGAGAADRHRNTFTDPGADHVPDSGPSAVVEEASRNGHGLLDALDHTGHWLPALVALGVPQTGSPAGGRPRLSEIADGRAVAMEDVLKIFETATFRLPSPLKLLLGKSKEAQRQT